MREKDKEAHKQQSSSSDAQLKNEFIAYKLLSLAKRVPMHCICCVSSGITKPLTSPK